MSIQDKLRHQAPAKNLKSARAQKLVVPIHAHAKNLVFLVQRDAVVVDTVMAKFHFFILNYHFTYILYCISMNSFLCMVRFVLDVCHVYKESFATNFSIREPAWARL